MCVFTVRSRSRSSTSAQIETRIRSPISGYLWPRLYLAAFPRYSASKEVENHPTVIWATRWGTAFEFRHQIYQVKSWDTCLLSSENCIILLVVVLLQHTRFTNDERRQTTYHDSSRTFGYNDKNDDDWLNQLVRVVRRNPSRDENTRTWCDVCRFIDLLTLIHRYPWTGTSSTAQKMDIKQVKLF